MEQLAKLNELFDKYKGEDGKVKFPEFQQLVDSIEGKSETLSDADALFRGVDQDNSQSVTKIEFMELAKAILTKDKVALSKTYFRAYDKDKSGFLEFQEVTKLYGQLGKTITDDEAKQICAEYGTEDKINFRQLYKNLYNEDLPEGESDNVYETKTTTTAAEGDQKDAAKSSKCCLLI